MKQWAYGHAEKGGRKYKGKGAPKNMNTLKAKVASMMKELEEEKLDRQEAVSEFRSLLFKLAAGPPVINSSSSRKESTDEDFKKADVASANLLNVFDLIIGGSKARKGA